MTEYVPTTEEIRNRILLGADMNDLSEEEREELAEFDRWLAALIREAKAEALIEAANQWTQGAWANRIPPRGSSRAQIILGVTQSAGGYMRTRAAEYRKGEER